ncbi:DUF2737 family protein [Salmonella enterica subsp. enterica serovar Lexington]|nr:DUF2737 family protein [Salmonella enterica subsp. enterica serovar Lexington]
MRGLSYDPGILPSEMLKRNSFPSVNENKYLNAMLRSGKK